MAPRGVEYQVVCDTEKELLKLLDDFPSLKMSLEPYPTSIHLGPTFDYLPWARHIFTLTIAHRRIILHRGYLGRSFTDPKFKPSHRACLDAVRAILKERRRLLPALYDRTWEIAQQTVTAGVVLVSEFRSASRDSLRSDQERTKLRQDVEDLVTILEKDSNAVAERGRALLKKLIEATATPTEQELATSSTSLVIPVATGPLIATSTQNAQSNVDFSLEAYPEFQTSFNEAFTVRLSLARSRVLEYSLMSMRSTPDRRTSLSGLFLTYGVKSCFKELCLMRTPCRAIWSSMKVVKGVERGCSEE